MAEEAGQCDRAGPRIAAVETQKEGVRDRGVRCRHAEGVPRCGRHRGPVGAVLARIAGGATAPAAARAAASATPAPVRPAPTAIQPLPREAPGARLRIPPAAARRAHELGVDARGLRGSGPQGAVTIADVAHEVRSVDLVIVAAPSACSALEYGGLRAQGAMATTVGSQSPTAAAHPGRPNDSKSRPRLAWLRAMALTCVGRGSPDIGFYELQEHQQPWSNVR